MTLRFVQEADCSALLALYRPYVEETTITFETEVPTQKDFLNRIRSISAEFPYLVAEDGGDILGYAYAHPFHERAAYDWTVELSIYLRRDCCGRGVGSSLFGALLDVLRLQGVQTAVSVATLPNPASLAIHRRFGFHEAGILPSSGYKLGAWRSVSYLILHLGDHAVPPAPLLTISQLPQEACLKILENAAGKI